jgi:hypothetical protein
LILRGSMTFSSSTSQFCDAVKKLEWPIGPKLLLDPVKGTQVFIHVCPAR